MFPGIVFPNDRTHDLIQQETSFLRTFHQTLTSIFHESSEEYALLSQAPSFDTLTNAGTTIELDRQKQPFLDLYKRVLQIRSHFFDSSFALRLSSAIIISSYDQEKERLCECAANIMEFLVNQLDNPSANKGIGLRLAHHLSKLECPSSKHPLKALVRALAFSRQPSWVFTLLETEKETLVTPLFIASLVRVFFTVGDETSMNRAFAQLENREDRKMALADIRGIQGDQRLEEIKAKLHADLL